jgi:hypothetical protein
MHLVLEEVLVLEGVLVLLRVPDPQMQGEPLGILRGAKRLRGRKHGVLITKRNT